MKYETISNKWPDREHPELGEPVLPELRGATIHAIGTTAGGLLAIEYTPAGARRRRVLVLAFNEARMWALSREQVAMISK